MLIRLQLFSKYVQKDRKRRAQLNEPGQLESTEKAILSASTEAQKAFTEKILGSMPSEVRKGLLRRLRI